MKVKEAKNLRILNCRIYGVNDELAKVEEFLKYKGVRYTRESVKLTVSLTFKELVEMEELEILSFYNGIRLSVSI